jgi:hypothetical protein
LDPRRVELGPDLSDDLLPSIVEVDLDGSRHGPTLVDFAARRTSDSPLATRADLRA